MASTPTPLCAFGTPAADFLLPGTDGLAYSLARCRGPRGLLVMFLCNHCPYVQAVLDHIIRDTRELAGLGIGSVAIMSNDSTRYPEDSFTAMQALAQARQLPFPYLYDESQAVARAYGAVCTPDFFGYNAALQLQYRGRLDASGRQALPAAPRELFAAMQEIARSGEGPRTQHASIGCSIKWKEA